MHLTNRCPTWVLCSLFSVFSEQWRYGEYFGDLATRRLPAALARLQSGRAAKCNNGHVLANLTFAESSHFFGTELRRCAYE